MFSSGTKKNPNIGYYMSAVGSDGYPFQHPEWYPRLYWLPIRERVSGPFVKQTGFCGFRDYNDNSRLS